MRHIMLSIVGVALLTGCSVVGPDSKTVSDTNASLKTWKQRAQSADHSSAAYQNAKAKVNGWINGRKDEIKRVAEETWSEKADMTVPPDVAASADAAFPGERGTVQDAFNIFKELWFTARKSNAQDINGRLDQYKLP